MSNDTMCFQPDDFADDLPAPGYYIGTISDARFRDSAQGNKMLQVVHHLTAVSPAYESVADYFVLEGASHRGIVTARRRLVNLYKSCGFDPKQGDQIRPSELIGSTLEVNIRHHKWQLEIRLRVAGYRPGPPI